MSFFLLVWQESSPIELGGRSLLGLTTGNNMLKDLKSPIVYLRYLLEQIEITWIAVSTKDDS